MRHHPFPLQALHQVTSTIKGTAQDTIKEDSILNSNSQGTTSSLHLPSSTRNSNRTVMIGGQARVAEDCWGNSSVEAAGQVRLRQATVVDTVPSLAMVVTAQAQARGIMANSSLCMLNLRRAAVELEWVAWPLLQVEVWSVVCCLKM